MGRGEAVQEVAMALELLQPLFGEGRNLGEVLAVGYNCRNRQEDQRGQGIVLGMVAPGILQQGEVLKCGHALVFGPKAANHATGDQGPMPRIDQPLIVNSRPDSPALHLAGVWKIRRSCPIFRP